jgi:diguanylate cyclase (GGDEF)-like protein/PAS domain S-box-containing protein
MTERKAAEEALRQAEARYRSIFEHAVEGIFQSTPDGQFLAVNPSLVRMLGYQDAEELITSIRDVGKQYYILPTTRQELTRLLKANGGVQGYECEVYRKDGSTIWTSENIRAVRSEEADHALLYYEGSVEDITARRRAERALRELAARDELTGLYNRRVMDTLLRREVKRYRRYGRPLSLLMLDIDRFKAVNDTYGHQAGDEVLRFIAQLLRDSLRATDLAARYGGEEFVIILPETNTVEAYEMAERVRKNVADLPVLVGSKGDSPEGQSVRITVSLGLASLGKEIVSGEALLAEADRALYVAKRSGRNRTLHNSGAKLKVAVEAGADA